MDNNPDKVNQNTNNSAMPPANPVFSSTDIYQSKAHNSGAYFTNVRKATPWQKLSEWMARQRRASEEASAVRRANLKAKRAAKKRAADIAAISREVPQNIPARMATAQPQQPIAQFPSNPTPSFPSQPQPTASFPATNPESQKNKKTLLAVLIIVALALIVGIILLILQPWAPSAPAPAPKPEPYLISDTGLTIKLRKDYEVPEEPDAATMTFWEASEYVDAILHSTTINVYEDNHDLDDKPSADIIASNIDLVLELNGVTEPSLVRLFDIEKARIYAIYNKKDSAWAILGGMDESKLYDSQRASFYLAMEQYYRSFGDTAQATAYSEKYNNLDGFIGGGD